MPTGLSAHDPIPTWPGIVAHRGLRPGMAMTDGRDWLLWMQLMVHANWFREALVTPSLAWRPRRWAHSDLRRGLLPEPVLGSCLHKKVCTLVDQRPVLLVGGKITH
jgi:hypothetical protein